MWKRLFIAVIVVLLLAPVRASADAEQDCEKGMAMLKAELKKKHPKAVRDQLQKVLKDAQKEDEDGDWDECVDAVKAGTRALGK
jgi:hypothetical protein